MWDPRQYTRYADERGLPFHDLLAHVGAGSPGYVADLGCGPGELTASLAARWPDARVEGVDSSAAMLEQAAGVASTRLAFTLADVRDWRPAEPVDVLVTNSTLQWVDGHDRLLTRWAGKLAPGGWLAVQVPGNFAAPSHTLLRACAARWADRLPGVTLREAPVLDPAGYWSLLTAAGCRVRAWETTYLQVLSGDDAVLEWTRGTALRPVLDALGPAEAAQFTREYGKALRAAYPPGPHGTLFPFRRIFAVAQRES